MRYITLLLLWALVTSAQTAKPDEPPSIEGRVINAVTGDPVGKVSLLLMRTDSTPSSYDWTRSYSASSDATGKFAVRNIDPGEYRLRASRNGFITLEYGARTSQRSGIVLDFDPPQQLKDVEVRLTPHGVIAGRLLDADGEPLERARVLLLRSQYVNGKTVLATTGTTYTNDLGEYRFSGLTPGNYYIYAENYEALPPTSAAQEDYVPSYYPGATDAAGASPLGVIAGGQVRAVDMLLHKARTARVRGRVVIELPDARGVPSVRFFPLLGHDNSAAGSFRIHPAKVNAAGEFEIRSLIPGSYSVMAEIATVRGIGATSPTTPVTVAGANIEDLVLTIRPGLSMTGRIRVDGETTQDLQNVYVKLQPGGSKAGSFPHGPIRVAKDRTFREDGLKPGRYGVMVGGLPDGFYAKSIRVRDTDVTYSGVDLTVSDSDPVDIIVSPKAGLVSGVAQNRKTNRVANEATVVLVPQEKERLGIAPFYQQATCDRYGRFAFKNVAPGEYKVYAWEDVEPTAWMDPDFMRPLEGKGETITVGESAQQNVQVNLIPADSER